MLASVRLSAATLLVISFLTPLPGLTAQSSEAQLSGGGTALEPTDAAARLEEVRGELERVERLLDREPERTDLRLDRIRVLYVLAVEEEWALDEAIRSLSGLKEGVERQVPSSVPLLRAYEGALEALRGKHSRWPPNKLSHVNRGLSELDRQVEVAGEELEIRYLRLVTGYFLPFVFRRGGQVQEDLRVLRTGLPRDVTLSPNVRAVIARFLLEHGEPTEEERSELLAGWNRACDRLGRTHSACSTPPETGAP